MKFNATFIVAFICFIVFVFVMNTLFKEVNITLLIALFSFVVFICLMNMILYKPVNKIIQQRKDFIDGNYNEAQRNNLKSEAILQDREEKISLAKLQTREKITNIVNEAKATKEEKTKDAKKQAQEILKNSKDISNKEKEEAIGVLKNEVVELAQLISDKLLKNHEEIENIDETYLESLIQG